MKSYTFNISLSILNHLGRNLYRSFITVLGEAISNSWDADAKKVWIYIDRDNNTLVIKDNGSGMTEYDFQNKFLKIGYSKRKDNVMSTNSGRPFIGRKGIGKLALLSCADKITILTKTLDSDLVGGIIDNSGLDEAIKDDVSANEYNLIKPSKEIIEKFSENFSNGTIIFFEGINDGIKNRIDYIRKLVALYFRFSLIDSNFSIILNDNEIKLEELKDLIDNTQLLWKINNPKDPYLNDYLEKKETLKKKADLVIEGSKINGFIASVEKPSMLKIKGSEEKVSIDLYVNGRLREKDILKHIPTARIVESYLYGQIHYNDLDDENDRFTSSREGVISDDPKFLKMLKEVEKLLKQIIEDWDVWRIELKQDGDSENQRIPPKERKSKELFNEISKDFIPESKSAINKKKVEVIYNVHNAKLIREKGNEEIPEKEKELLSHPYILFCGRLDENKAPSRALESFANAQKPSDAKIIYIGGEENGQLDHLLRKAKEFGIDDKVHYLGRKTNPYVYIKQASALISSSYSEGLPGVIIESLILGTPVITNSSKGIWEIFSCSNEYQKDLSTNYVTDSGIITPNLSHKDSTKKDFDVHQLSDAISHIWQFPKLKSFTFEEKVSAEYIYRKFL